MENKIDILKQWILESDNIVFFGGAGVSTESGIPDFRSKDGLYNQKFNFSPEVILSHSFFIEKTSDFYEFYKEKMDCREYEANITHNFLTKLETEGKLKGIITQNIDGLHHKANSKNILELHGSIYRNYCMKCYKFYEADFVFNSKGVPKCECGGIIKPDVVLYEEELDQKIINEAIKLISSCDLLIIGGTSLSVYPACNFIDFYNGKRKVIINNNPTKCDESADLVINEKLGEVFKRL